MSHTPPPHLCSDKLSIQHYNLVFHFAFLVPKDRVGATLTFYLCNSTNLNLDSYITELRKSTFVKVLILLLTYIFIFIVSLHTNTLYILSIVRNAADISDLYMPHRTTPIHHFVTCHTSISLNFTPIPSVATTFLPNLKDLLERFELLSKSRSFVLPLFLLISHLAVSIVLPSKYASY